MTKNEALKLALEALEFAKEGKTGWTFLLPEAISALREVLAEPPALPQPEPGRNHWEGGDVFERITARMNRRVIQKAEMRPYQIPGMEWVSQRLRKMEIKEGVRMTINWDGMDCDVTLSLVQEPAQQEPVAVVTSTPQANKGLPDVIGVRMLTPLLPNTKLYTSPPAQRTWVGLTDEMLADCVPDEALIVERGGERTRVSMTRQQLHEFANRAIEAARGIKE